jgi:hypothetical protein
VRATIRTFGKLDVLVNNAGYGNVAPIEDTTLEEFRAQIETNLFGVIILTKAVLPYFRERGSGHIIQVTSIAGRIGPIGRAPYAAAKWGVEGFSETLAKEVEPFDIVEHGGFRTDFAGSSTQLREGRPEYDATVGKAARFQRDYNGKQPGDPTRAAAALLKLASVKEPPLRVVLGSDAFNAAEANDLAKIELGKKWKDLSYTTDFVKLKLNYLKNLEPSLWICLDWPTCTDMPEDIGLIAAFSASDEARQLTEKSSLEVQRSFHPRSVHGTFQPK